MKQPQISESRPAHQYFFQTGTAGIRVRVISEAESLAFYVCRTLAPDKQVTPETVIDEAVKLLKAKSKKKSFISKTRKAKNALSVRRTRT